MSLSTFQEHLDKCKDYGCIFDLVKRAVKEKIGRERIGLMLYLANLPLHLGAFHQLGSNGIIVNKRLLNIIFKSAKSITEVNSFIFTLLLHEYLHSLGYVDEQQVKRLVYEISRDAFGTNHPATQMALHPQPRIPLSEIQRSNRDIELELELVKDFERSKQSYIS